MRLVLVLAWCSVGWMAAEGALGLVAGARSGSVALTGWALSSAVEGVASVLVIWRFTGARALSEEAERRAQRGVGVSFWLLAPYVAAQSIGALLSGDHPRPTVLGQVLTGSSVLLMPGLGWAKQRLGARLGSSATRGEGTQNLLCAAVAAAVLVGLAANAAAGAGWLDPLIGLCVAGVAVREGSRSWQGAACC